MRRADEEVTTTRVLVSVSNHPDLAGAIPSHASGVDPNAFARRNAMSANKATLSSSSPERGSSSTPGLSAAAEGQAEWCETHVPRDLARMWKVGARDRTPTCREGLAKTRRTQESLGLAFCERPANAGLTCFSNKSRAARRPNSPGSSPGM